MKSAIASSLVSIGLTTVGLSLALGLDAAHAGRVPNLHRVPTLVSQTPSSVLIANRRAEDTCVNAVEDRGLRVVEVVEQTEYAGGAEVILRVQDRNRNRNQTYRVGCDYASSTREVQLYRIEGSERDIERDDDSDRDRFDSRFRAGESVRDRATAEDIARQAIEDRLEVNANSEVIAIEETRERGQAWQVRGRVNGAPFEVRIRSRDGSIEEFQLQ